MLIPCAVSAKRKKKPAAPYGAVAGSRTKNLLALVAVAASAGFRIAGTGVPDVDFGKSTIVARAVEFASRDVAADTGIDVFAVLFVHHS